MQFSRRMTGITALLAVVLALSACVVTTPTPGAPGTDEPVTPPSGETTEPPIGTATPAVPVGVNAALTKLAEQMDSVRRGFTVLSVTEAEWPDGCLGLAGPDEMCTQAIVPGYSVMIETDEGQLEVRTNESGSQVRAAPETTARPTTEPMADVVLMWRQQTDAGCRAAQISGTGVQYGPCDGALTPGILNETMARAAQLTDMVATYAAFNADTLAGEVTFAGEGPLTATEAEQRMLAEWASQVAQEAETGSATATQGLALVWHREGGIAGFCDDLSVYVTGVAYGSDCRGNTIQNLGSRRLTADELAEFYTWVDTLASFQETQKDPATADAMSIGIMLAGRGQQAATQQDKDAISQFAGQVLLRWADPTPVPTVLAQADVTIYAGPADSYPVIGQVAAGQSARVTGVNRDSTWWRVVCPDDSLGNCWVSGDSSLTQPNVPPGATAVDPIDETGIYAAVVRQVYTVDHTFGDNAPNFPRIYLLRADDVQAGDGPGKGVPVIAAPIQQAIVAALSDLPAQFTWIDTFEDAPRDENGTIKDNGAVITLGNIQEQPDGKIYVAASIYFASLGAGGQTYVLEKVGDTWQITGNTGTQWMS